MRRKASVYQKPLNQFTFYNCDKCGNPLRESEVVNGTTCTHCLIESKRTDKEKREQENIFNFLSQIDPNKIMVLETISISWAGDDFRAEIFSEGDYQPMCRIFNSSDELIYNCGQYQQIGKEVFDILIVKKLINPKTK